MDTSVLEEVDNKLVALKILITQVHNEAKQHLFAHHLIAMHVAHILELWLLCNTISIIPFSPCLVIFTPKFRLLISDVAENSTFREM